MMGTNLNVNKVFESGRLIADPKYTEGEIPRCEFTIAVTRPYLVNGQQKADFFDCVCFRKTATVIARYFKKGDPIFLMGSFEGNAWTGKDGVKRYTYQINVDEFRFVESAKPKEGGLPDGEN